MAEEKSSAVIIIEKMRVEHIRNSQAVYLLILLSCNHCLITEKPSFTRSPLLLQSILRQINLKSIYFHFINIIRRMIPTERVTQLLQTNFV